MNLKKLTLIALIFSMIFLVRSADISNQKKSIPIDAYTDCYQIDKVSQRCVTSSNVRYVYNQSGELESCDTALKYFTIGNNLIFVFGNDSIVLSYDYKLQDVVQPGDISEDNVNLFTDFNVKRDECNFEFEQNLTREDVVISELSYEIPDGFTYDNVKKELTKGDMIVSFEDANEKQGIEINEQNGKLILTGENITRLDPTAGYNEGGTAYVIDSGGDCSWANLNNILSEALGDTTCDTDAFTDTYGVRNYGFALPDYTDSIDGVGVAIKRSCESSGDCEENIIQLIIDGTGAGDNKATATAWGSTSTYAYYGSDSDTWGNTLNYSQINSQYFGVKFRGEGTDRRPHKLEMDVIKVNVTYTLGATDDEYPLFTNIDDNNGTVIDSGIVVLNSTITSTNGSAGVNFDGTNYSASNLSSLFNVSFSKSGSGVYDYYWWAYGNGTNNNYNQSQMQGYTIIQSNPLINISFISPDEDMNATRYQIFNFTFNLSCLDFDCNNITTAVVYENVTGQIGTGKLDYSNISEDGTTCGVSTSNFIDGDWLTKFEDNDCSYFINYTTPLGTSYADVGTKLIDVSVYCFNETSSGFLLLGSDGNFTIPNECYTGDKIQLKFTHSGASAGNFYEQEVHYNTTKVTQLVNINSTTNLFTTNITNPFNESLSADTSKLIQVYLNATGEVGTTKIFYAYSNLSENLSVSAMTEKHNVTIISSDCVYSGSGDWIINTTCNINNQDIELFGNLSVQDSGFLNMTGDTNITFSQPGSYIFVYTGGGIDLYDTAKIN